MNLFRGFLGVLMGVFSTTFVFAQSAAPAVGAARFVGLWGTTRSFGPAIRGELTITLAGDESRAAIGGTSVPVRPSGAAVAFTLPDKIEWKQGSGRAQQAILAGDPSKPGIYVVMVKWLPGGMSRPHFHPNDRFITVLKGTWWVGTGTKFDPNSTVPMPAGTFVTHFGKQVHYDGAKDEEAVLLITGEGPATSTPAEEK